MNDLKSIKGLGSKTILSLEKLGINNVKDLIEHYPFRYDVLKRSDIFSLNQDDRIIIDGYVESLPSLFRFKGNMNKMTFRINTNETILKVIIYNRGFLKNNLIINKLITVIGKYDLSKNTIIASNILLEGIGNEERIETIYHINNGIKMKNLKKYIDEALLITNEVIDYIPNIIVNKYSFLDKKTSLNIIHHPSDISLLKKALLRSKYEELFIYMLKINILKEKNQKIIDNHSKIIDNNIINDFINKLPFKLTSDQLESLEDIKKDLRSNKTMNRMIQGDVGSGKTIVALITVYMMYLNNYQSALMVPTEILAKQHYDNFKHIFKDTDLNISLLIGSTSKKEKEVIYDNLKNGHIDLVIGTHALMQEKVNYDKLGLVITDEQHRFGVNQRGLLKNKGNEPDILYMSATPIPRTYALTIYGDMDISNIKTKPSNRKDIITYLKQPNEIKEVLTMIYKELKLNHQIYVVAPLIEESENSDLENVAILKNKFELAFGSHYKIGVLHGKMSSKEKEAIMNDFINKNTHILISTTVIEVGIDVKDATMMIIFEAKMFGLSTLHQLRGRVGRSDLQSYCILISDKEKERLKIMTETNDGFIISEEDFRLRGQGDLFGIKQSGDMTFKLADLKKDFKILVQAKEDVKIFMDNDLIDKYPHLKSIIERSINLD